MVSNIVGNVSVLNKSKLNLHFFFISLQLEVKLFMNKYFFFRQSSQQVNNTN